MHYKLEKKLEFHRTEFDRYIYDTHGEYKLDRLSIDIDGLLFRIRYMIKNDIDLYKLNGLRKEFNAKSSELRKLFGNMVYHYISTSIKFEMDKSFYDITDILIRDIKMDTKHIVLDIILISDKLSYLEYVDESIEDGKVIKLYPSKFFRYEVDSYNDGIAKAYSELFTMDTSVNGVGNDKDVFVHSITFQTSECCSLKCLYCYQINKSPMRMNFDVAKKFIDELLDDKYGYVNRHNSPAVILEFIGGEPLLEIKLTRKIYEYFLDRSYKMDHPWFKLHRVSICSNGMQYFDKEVQDFFKEYITNISFNISIDGNKELHDACRIQPNGEGSYDIDLMALNHFNRNHSKERSSKMTLAPSNIKYLYESVVDFIKNDMSIINLNCIFEEGWNQETALLEYTQLKQLADYVIENGYENISISIFNERQEDMHEKSMDSNACGGTGSMLSIRPNGQFYPCIRYMPTSVGSDRDDMSMGDVQTGMIGRGEESAVLKKMDMNTRRGQMNDVCYNCPIGNDCPSCSALGTTVFNDCNKRATFICIQTIAEALANVYYWNNLLLRHPEYDLPVRKNNVPDEWALLVINNEELENLKLLECAAMIKKIENSGE